ncbi:class I SAM-dependent methyltransferase [Rhizophagus clarus]|uniref:Class I SAM-dependent methyltransferase n=2 Tax=Rhizophagus clarus TaxID=94130 RepID=A0A8H3LL95_9GLOM|nr:class I SAM-dependent methyltransferase [Rhizophagus clarus]
MTTFSQVNYDSSAYNAYRPTYGEELYEKIYSFHRSHNGKFDNALDIATGTGQVAIDLSKSFKQVYAVDISSTMIQNAIKNPNITYSISSAEDLSQFSSNSVDLVTAATSAHWFNITEFFNESFRVLKPQGTLAIWCYGQNILKDYPDYKHLILNFLKDEFGPFYDKRLSVVENFYRDFKFSEEMFQNVKWEIYDGEETPDVEPLFTNEWTVPRFVKYIKTWSYYKSYMEANPNSPDPIDKLIADLKQRFKWKDNEVLQVHWRSVLILAERRSILNQGQSYSLRVWLVPCYTKSRLHCCSDIIDVIVIYWRARSCDGYKVEEIGVNEINKIEETDKVEETDEVEQIDDIEETDEIDETDEVEEIDEIGEIDEVEEIDEMEFEKGLTTNKNKAQILEYKNLEIVNIDVVNDLDDSEIDELDEDDICTFNKRKESDCYIKEPSWKKKEISVNAISKESNLSEERTKVATNVRLIL